MRFVLLGLKSLPEEGWWLVVGIGKGAGVAS